MKEVESGRKLRHVETNDRSKPILKSETITNIQGQFVYETEKENVRNAFLKEIQFGIRLKSVKTNDRSKPVLEGLRKFRRQMTIEEQIQKSESRAQLGQLANNEVIWQNEINFELQFSNEFAFVNNFRKYRPKNLAMKWTTSINCATICKAPSKC